MQGSAPKTFVAIFNAMYMTKHRTVASCMKYSASDDALVLERVQNTFGVLVVVHGLREMGTVNVPPAWASQKNKLFGTWGLHARQLFGHWGAIVIARMDLKDFDQLIDAYEASRDKAVLSVEREMGTRFGYLQPLTPNKVLADATVYVHIYISDDNHARTVMTEFGPQSIYISSTPTDLLPRLHELQQRLAALAQLVHADLHIMVDLRLGG